MRRGVALSPRTGLFPARGHPDTARLWGGGGGTGQKEHCGAPRAGDVPAPRGDVGTRREAWPGCPRSRRERPHGPPRRVPRSAPRHPAPPHVTARGHLEPRPSRVPALRCQVSAAGTHVSPRAPTPARPRATRCPRGAVPGPFPRPAVLRGRVWPFPGGRGAARCRAAVPRAGAQRCARGYFEPRCLPHRTSSGKSGGVDGGVRAAAPPPPHREGRVLGGRGCSRPPPSVPPCCCSPAHPLQSCGVPTGPRSPCLAVCHRGHSVPQFPHLQG